MQVAVQEKIEAVKPTVDNFKIFRDMTRSEFHAEVDRLLEKISKTGINSLTPEEMETLKFRSSLK